LAGAIPPAPRQRNLSRSDKSLPRFEPRFGRVASATIIKTRSLTTDGTRLGGGNPSGSAPAEPVAKRQKLYRIRTKVRSRRVSDHHKKAKPDYFTSYLTKTWKAIQVEKKRVRLITYARNVVSCASVHFSWNGPAGINWRRKKRMFAFSCGCFTLEMAKENLGATWEYKYRLEIASQKLPHYDSAECMIADRFQELTLASLIENNLTLGAIEYWMRLRRRVGLILTNG
jgi:hypothetical protein